MESKRKANGATAVDNDDRGSKRRRLTGDFDLSKGESRESTTTYGLSFLEHIRKTADKAGRLVATNFEELPPREENADYYEQTRMPISLSMIEQKLNDGEFENLSELEGYFKRMISNAKEFYPRGTEIFEDAERLRKAVSNYMTKKNPAYHVRGYQAVPTPFPDDDDEEEANEDNEDEEMNDNEDEDEPEEEKEDEDEEDEEDEEEEAPSSRRRTITLKRRTPGRTPGRRASTRSKETPKPAAPAAKPDHVYEDVPYKGLTFQQAQEKLIEELIRREDPGYDGPYFEAFINLPPRSLKEYFKVISDPMSIRKLQKAVKGFHGRGGSTGVSDFKSWAAFEEKAKLLWTNAYFYNEEGSEIYLVAQDLEKFFYDQLKQAQAVVTEPSQPKIKLKVGGSSETPTPGPKKITIHVGGQRDSADSPAPAQSKMTLTNGQTVNGTARTSTPAQAINPQLEKARSTSLSAVPSPSPSVQSAALKADEASRASPAVPSQPPSAAPSQATPAVPAAAPVAVPAPVPVAPPQPITNPLVNGYMDQKHPRRAGKGIDDALIESMKIQVHPTLQSHSPVLASIRPNPKEMEQSAILNLPPHLTRILAITAIPSHLQNRQYSLWTLVNKQPLKPIHHQAPGQQPHERAFEAMLHPGLNVLESHLIAAIPRHERVPGGPEVELEVFTISINVLRN